MKAVIALLLAILLLAPGIALAGPAPLSDPAQAAGFEQRLGAQVPTDLSLRDESGVAVRLGDYLGDKPAVLLFAYYGCTSLCPTVIANTVRRLDAAAPPADEAPAILVVSIDPLDTPDLAARMRTHYLATLGRDGAAARMHLLTGSAGAIARITADAGFRYAYDDRTQQFAHAAGIVLLTPQGRIARYFFGFGYTPQQLAQALHEAAQQRIASPVERLLLLCFHFDPTGRYTATVIAALRGLGLALVAVVPLVVLVRRQRQLNDRKAR
jgi:protein SCO1/2